MPKANLWIINYCILEMKADNEPAISLAVYFKPVKKLKYVLLKNKKKTQKDQKRKRKKVSIGENRTPDLRCVRSSRYVSRHVNYYWSHTLN